MRHTLQTLIVAILIQFTLMGCVQSGAEATAAEPVASDVAPASDAGAPVCRYVDAWLADPEDVSFERWFGELDLPAGACIDVACSADHPRLRLCRGKGAPPIEVE